ncbi:MAG TPA: helix-turn-helix domain-containing protein [Acidimicrobiales bacterium]|nr:helix-turn-helix domain-containing protein [Acidimicrobiales bacterium]
MSSLADAPESRADDHASARPGGEWTFLTNHAHVLICLAKDSSARQRDIAHDVGITERAAQKIISELEAGGYVERIKVGRRNRYVLHEDIALRHPLEAHRDIGSLLDLITGPRD